MNVVKKSYILPGYNCIYILLLYIYTLMLWKAKIKLLLKSMLSLEDVIKQQIHVLFVSMSKAKQTPLA